MHDPDLHTPLCKGAEAGGHCGSEWIALAIRQLVVAGPILEQVAQHVQGAGADRLLAQETEELFVGGRALACEVQVGNEQRPGHHPYITSCRPPAWQIR